MRQATTKETAITFVRTRQDHTSARVEMVTNSDRGQCVLISMSARREVTNANTTVQTLMEGNDLSRSFSSPGVVFVKCFSCRVT